MRLEQMYAHALVGVAGEPKKILTSLRAALKSRGHEKLLPRIFSEYQRLELQKERSAMHKKVTPERERTKILLELYRKLAQ